jgi:hypothetical protein
LPAAGVRSRSARSTHRALLGRDWRCPEPGCPLFGVGDRPGTALPHRRDDQVLCPVHGLPLTDGGPLPSRVQVKVVKDGTVRGRFTVTAGEPLPVGRAPGAGGVALGTWVGEFELNTVSRTHVVLHYDGAGLTVVERSTNGTRVRRARPAGDELVSLPHGSAWVLGRGDAIVLPDRLELLPVGPAAMARRPDGPVAAPSGATTPAWRPPPDVLRPLLADLGVELVPGDAPVGRKLTRLVKKLNLADEEQLVAHVKGEEVAFTTTHLCVRNSSVLLRVPYSALGEVSLSVSSEVERYSGSNDQGGWAGEALVVTTTVSFETLTVRLRSATQALFTVLTSFLSAMEELRAHHADRLSQD